MKWQSKSKDNNKKAHEWHQLPAEGRPIQTQKYITILRSTLDGNDVYMIWK